MMSWMWGAYTGRAPVFIQPDIHAVRALSNLFKGKFRLFSKGQCHIRIVFFWIEMK